MASQNVSRIFVIGATGAQGLPVVSGLVGDGAYSVLALTRQAGSARARSLLDLGNVAFLEGTFADEETLRTGMRACDGAFVNIDGFNAGERTEMYWAIRSYEIALEEGVKFFVYGNLDYTLKRANYDSRFRCGHYDGKGRIGEWILSQNAENRDRMAAALFTTGPYMEMAFSSRTPMTPNIEDGTVTWRVPLGNGAVPHVALDDCRYYVRWLFDHPDRADGMDLAVAIEPIRYDALAAAFTRVTGHPARYIDIDIAAYFRRAYGEMASLPAGYNADPKDKSTMSLRDNFTGFWNQWKYDIIKRDYALLDEIHPGRIRNVEQWLHQQDQAERAAGRAGLWDKLQPENLRKYSILKLGDDLRRGTI